jgi:SAM-dependent methyltransferase
MSTAKTILFANYAIANCGVHQYGHNLFDVLRESRRFEFVYAGITSLADLDDAVAKTACAALIVNHHPQTLSFVRIDAPRRYPVACIAVMHEMTKEEADCMSDGFFQYYVMGDPTLCTANRRVFATGRIIPAYENRSPLPEIVTIGSFGFSVGSKGFRRLVDVVQDEFDEAVIRINIPANGIIDKDATLAHEQLDRCRERLWKPGIRLVGSHEFMDAGKLLEFLASNTLNAFLYDYLPQAGISSAVDQAMTARRPLAITRSVMFRHLFDLKPPITIENASLREIIQNGIEPYRHLLTEWAPDRIRQRYESILEEIFLRKDQLSSNSNRRGSRHFEAPQGASGKRHMKFLIRVINGVKRRLTRYVWTPARYAWKWVTLNVLLLLGVKKPRGLYNRILDDRARIEYAGVIARLGQAVPGIMAKKIPRANIQQAFIFDAVKNFAAQFSKPRMLCIGSFEDTAAITLKKLGHSLMEIDPVINKLDLDAFTNLPTTKPGTYDIVFSTSVLEHVRDDEKFVRQMADLLAPGGVGILTCDFKEGYKIGDPVIDGDYRFYTKQDLSQRLLANLGDCELVDAPGWDCVAPDFELGGFKYTFATLAFRKRKERDFDVDWETLTPAEQARFFNQNGFLVIPGALTGKEVRQAVGEIKEHGLKGTTEDVWSAPFARRLVINDKLLSALKAIFGEGVRFFKAAYVESPPDSKHEISRQRKALHVDYGIGEPEGDFRNSAASWVNVAFYLTDLSAEHSPLWVVPGSNRDYSVVPASDHERFRAAAKMVLARAGDIVLFHSNTVHAASHNFSDETRHALFYSYRPAWAKPVGPVQEWPEAFIGSFPAEHRELLKGLNRGI